MNMNAIIGIAVSVILVAGFACTSKNETATNSSSTTNNAANTAQNNAAGGAQMGAAATTGAVVTELKIEDLQVGTGAEAVAGKKVTVHYTGWLTNGTKFDSSLDRGQPFPFPLGAGRVIQGWDKGVAGMKVGGKRKLTIPPQMAYGERGAPPVIPPNSTLIFEVQLLGVDG